ncbi:Transcriptional activator NphR [compost metagenome]
MLLDPRLKLAEISERVGYQDMRHFTQQFRKKFGQTPSQYREACAAAGADKTGR